MRIDKLSGLILLGIIVTHAIIAAMMWLPISLVLNTPIKETDSRKWCDSFDTSSCKMDLVNETTVEVFLASIEPSKFFNVLDQSKKIDGWRLYGVTVSPESSDQRLNLRIQFVIAEN